jgi:hypothetical protein
LDKNNIFRKPESGKNEKKVGKKNGEGFIMKYILSVNFEGKSRLLKNGYEEL